MVYLQFSIAVVALMCAALAPPSKGAMLIISLDDQGVETIASWALSDDVYLLGAGPVPNSLLVSGSRASLGEAAFRHGSLLLRWSLKACGTDRG